MLELITLITFYGSIIAIVAYLINEEDKRVEKEKACDRAFKRAYEERAKTELRMKREKNKKNFLNDLQKVKSNQWI